MIPKGLNRRVTFFHAVQASRFGCYINPFDVSMIQQVQKPTKRTVITLTSGASVQIKQSAVRVLNECINAAWGYKKKYS